jgi:hypothetical protein
MRALVRSVTWVVLAALLAVQPAVWVAAHHADLEDDAACALRQAVTGPHHQGGSQVEEPNLPNPIEHCVFCHLQNAWGSARLGIPVAIAVPAPDETAPTSGLSALTTIPRRLHDLRGPPSSSL